MSARVRWIVVGVAAVLVLGVAALYLFNLNLAGVTLDERGDRRTWTIRGGDSVKLSAGELRPDDRFRCGGEGGISTVPTAPAAGHRVRAGFLVVTAAEDGSLTLDCAERA